jgi:hypothetical protein
MMTVDTCAPRLSRQFEQAGQRSAWSDQNGRVSVDCTNPVALVLGGMALDVVAKAYSHRLTAGTSTPGQVCHPC